MQHEIYLWCSKCNGQIGQNENAYCSSCLDKKHEELHVQDDLIDRLHNKIKELENFIEGLKKELEHGNTYIRDRT